MKSVIAIDGPAGAGKSTIARKLAKKLNYRYLDTGAMYRAVTYYAIKSNIDISNKKKLVEIAKNIDITFKTNDNNKTNIFVNNEDVSKKIRKRKIDNNVSEVAKISGVRKEMVKIQQDIAKDGKIIVDGRDIASRVLPNADLKIYLTASVEERAKRRHEELLEKGEESSFDKIKDEIKKRDKLDKNREHSPLIKTEDAILIDSTNLSIEEVINKIMSLIVEEGD
ncbi:MAG: (d)CMP kinase [Bacillota bacterium]